VFRASLELREEDPKNPHNYVTVPREKDYFKLRKNVERQILIQIDQLSNKPLEIERCFGLLISPGRNVSHKDMQLLQTISMGKSLNTTSDSNQQQQQQPSNGTNNNNNSFSGYRVCAHWVPTDVSASSTLQVYKIDF
jgi:hypothetical protein